MQVKRRNMKTGTKMIPQNAMDMKTKKFMKTKHDDEENEDDA